MRTTWKDGPLLTQNQIEPMKKYDIRKAFPAWFLKSGDRLEKQSPGFSESIAA